MNPTIHSSTNPQHPLDRVADLQQAFKSEALRHIARKIVTRVMFAREIWPDEISLADVSEADRHCVGIVWRWLQNVGLIAPGNEWRKSEAEHSKGRKIFKYTLHSFPLCEAFLKKNPEPEAVAVATETQEEFFH